MIFTTSFGYIDDTVKAAEKYSDTKFMHCSGFKHTANPGIYFGDLYQMYYLDGIMAGALTKSNKLGYVASFPIPELIRLIDTYALDTKATETQRGGGNISLIRSACVLVGSVFSAFAGAHLSTSYSSSWVEGMTAGRGWITITLTILALWNPGRAIFASFIFGGIFVLQYLLQLRNFSQFSGDAALPVYDRNPSDHLL